MSYMDPETHAAAEKLYDILKWRGDELGQRYLKGALVHLHETFLSLYDSYALPDKEKIRAITAARNILAGALSQITGLQYIPFGSGIIEFDL